MNSLILYSKIITGKQACRFTSTPFYIDNGEDVASKIVKYITTLFVIKEF